LVSDLGFLTLIRGFNPIWGFFPIFICEYRTSSIHLLLLAERLRLLRKLPPSGAAAATLWTPTVAESRHRRPSAQGGSSPHPSAHQLMPRTSTLRRRPPDSGRGSDRRHPAGAVEEQGPVRRWCGGGDGRPLARRGDVWWRTMVRLGK
jgi:hypothetical protein